MMLLILFLMLLFQAGCATFVPDDNCMNSPEYPTVLARMDCNRAELDRPIPNPSVYVETRVVEEKKKK